MRRCRSRLSDWGRGSTSICYPATFPHPQRDGNVTASRKEAEPARALDESGLRNRPGSPASTNQGSVPVTDVDAIAVLYTDIAMSAAIAEAQQPAHPAALILDHGRGPVGQDTLVAMCSQERAGSEPNRVARSFLVGYIRFAPHLDLGRPSSGRDKRTV